MSVQIEDSALKAYLDEYWPDFNVTLIPYPSFLANNGIFVMKIEGELEDCSYARYMPFTSMKTKNGENFHQLLKKFGEENLVIKGVCEEAVATMMDEMNIPNDFTSWRQIPDDMLQKMRESGPVEVVMYNVLVCENGTIYHRYT